MQRHTPEVVAEHVNRTLQAGNKVLVYSDVIAPSAFNLERADHLPAVLRQLPEENLERGERIEFGTLGFALLLSAISD